MTKITDQELYDIFVEAYNNGILVTKNPMSLVQFIVADKNGRVRSRSELISKEGVADANALFARIMEVGAEFSSSKFSLRMINYSINAKTPNGKHRISTASRSSFGKERHDLFLFEVESNTGLVPERTDIKEIDGLMGKWGAVGKTAIQDEVMARLSTAFLAGQNMAAI